MADSSASYTIDSGDTAWTMMCTTLVFLMVLFITLLFVVLSKLLTVSKMVYVDSGFGSVLRGSCSRKECIVADVSDHALRCRCILPGSLLDPGVTGFIIQYSLTARKFLL